MKVHNFKVGSNYTRAEIYKIVTGKTGKMPFNFQQTGYDRIDDSVFAFINAGYVGQANKIFPNKYDENSKILNWFGKKKTHSNQPEMIKMINGEVDIYCFMRWEDKVPFKFLGIGKVIDFKDGAEVFDQTGKKTFCLEFKLSLDDKNVNPVLINNFDQSFEEIPQFGTEGAIKYVQHKTRERDKKVIDAKKREFFKKNGRLFCEVCMFDFKEKYGSRGDGFIECHHRIPLSEAKSEIKPKLSDFALLCSNCHRMIHRKKKWLSVNELKKIFNKRLRN